MEEFYDSLEDNFSSASSSSIPSGKPHQNSEIWETVELREDSSIIIIKAPSRTPRKHHPSKSSVCISEKEFDNKCSLKSNTDIHLIDDISPINIPPIDISSIVPLYDGDKNRSEIKKSRSSSSSPVLKCEGSKNFTQVSMSSDGLSTNRNSSNQPKQRSKIGIYRRKQSNVIGTAEAIASKIPLKSYLGMFHARLGYPGAAVKKEYPGDSVRSMYGDSYRSEISEEAIEKDEFVDAEDDRSDTTSFYLQQIEEDKMAESSSKSSTATTMSHSMMHSVSQLGFRSISEIISNDRVPQRRNFRPTKMNQSLLPVPILGGLGPNTGANLEKLERRQRQLKYGQKASNRNRIRQMERKVLKNLEDEIKESNSVDNIQEV